jgi:MFS family permease
MWAGIAEGLTYLRDEPRLRAIMLMTSVMTIFGFPYAVLMPVMARDALGQDAGGYGQLMAATGVGAFAGALAVATLGAKLPRGRILQLGQLAFAISLLVFALNRIFPLSLLILMVLGFSMITYMTTANTVLQSTTPPELRGRVMSVWTLVAFGLTPLGSLQAGTVATFFGAPIALAVGAVICAAIGVGVELLTPELRSV